MTTQGKFGKPHSDYKCPLCPDHVDEVFVWSAILQKTICEGCDYELWDAIICEQQRCPDNQALERLEQLTPLTFDEYRLVELDRTVLLLSEDPNADLNDLAKYRAEATCLRVALEKRLE